MTTPQFHISPIEILGVRFVPLSTGCFTMGSDAADVGRRHDECAHVVTLTTRYAMAISPVNRHLFSRFVAATGYVTDAERRGGAYCFRAGAWDRNPQLNWCEPGFPQTDDDPVTCVSWNDVLALCHWMTSEDDSGRIYRLPTEAEWEYACRAGTSTAWSWGDSPVGSEALCNHADLAGEASGHHPGRAQWRGGDACTSRVGSYPSNSWGLCDMHGNVWEWCHDWYGPYSESPCQDPSGPSRGKNRVIRGGSWHHVLDRCRSAARFAFDPAYANVSLGGRVCYTIQPSCGDGRDGSIPQ
jgi:sulfatase modifying factor 1